MDPAPAALTRSIHCTALSFLPAAVPVDLVATERRPTYLVVQWTAPPSPFSGNYLLTYGPNDTMMVLNATFYNITGLQPFTNYRVSVQASNAPVVDYGPTLSGVFATLPEAEILPGGEVPTVAVPQAGVGSSEIVEIMIPAPTFTQDHLRYIKVWLTMVDVRLCSKFCLSCELPWTVYASARSASSTEALIVAYTSSCSSPLTPTLVRSLLFLPQSTPPLCSHLWVVCIRNILPTTRNTAPDTAFPDNSTFGTYDNAEDNVPYVASEFDAAGINFPYTFGVGNESEPNDFPYQYRNGPVMAGRNLDCFVRYFVSTEVRGEQAPHAHSSPALTPCVCLLPPAGHANGEEEEECSSQQTI